VPADVRLLLHFCYGDANHRQAVEPTDMVAMVNALRRKLSRPIGLLHMRCRATASTTPISHRCAGSTSRPTRSFASASCYTDGIEGTRRRMDAACKYVRDYAVGTECGFGRRDPRTILELLRIHVAASEYA
jgi:hypothetical protein